MVNILGENGYNGLAQYIGLTEILKIDGVYVHLYGKLYTKPFRKMGHVTVIDTDLKRAKQKALEIKKILKVVAE
jgi:5-(carboxyamino)imidazole ribonucleotide synthase